jgi:hypothetical protein
LVCILTVIRTPPARSSTLVHCRASCRRCHMVPAMFDPTSGQVYKEWTVSRPSLTVRGGDRDWSRRRPYSLFTPRGAKGPRSLIDMATHVVANNVGDMTEQHLEGLPVRLLWRIWRFLEARFVVLIPWHGPFCLVPESAWTAKLTVMGQRRLFACLEALLQDPDSSRR